MPSLFSRILRFALRLVLGLFAAVFALSLLLAALVVLAASLLTSLITGRKPKPAMVFGRFQRFSQQGMWPGRESAARPSSASDVVDVEVREVRDTLGNKRLP